MNTLKVKAFGLIIGIVVFLIAVVVLLYVIFNDSESDKENFPTYDKITIDEEALEDESSENYNELKNKLETDYNFAKEALISNYNYKNYTSADLESMIWHYIFAYELNNRNNLSKFDAEAGVFCMREKYVISSFEELYGVKITKDIESLDGYINYVTYEKEKYCLHYKNVAREYGNEIKLLVDGISVKEGIVTANIYLYEYYTSDTLKERENIEQLNAAIKRSNINDANSIVKNDLNGKVTHKQLEFRVQNGGDFFKYQILKSKNLEY